MNDGQTLTLATRGSDLAIAQAQSVAQSLEPLGVQARLRIIKTAGDESQAERFSEIGPQGVFAREIEQALVDGTADLAVHSYKDLPTQSPAGLSVAAVPRREDAHDVLLIRKDALRTTESFAPIERAAKVGTSSARRQAWLRHFRHDLDLAPLRGNVPTRIGRLRNGDYDAIVLAAAGLDRLQQVEALLDPLLSDISVIPLDMDTFVPAPAQGALAVQCRSDDKAILELLEQLDDKTGRLCIEAERDALAHAEGGCEVAFGAHCRHSASGYQLVCMLERNGQVHTITQTAKDPEGLGAAAWQALEREFSAG
jgi:hydroxymethylbilane synthase